VESTSTRPSMTYGQRINLLSDFNVIRYTRSLKNGGKNIVRFIKYFRLRWGGHVESMQNQRMPKQIAAATAEGIRNRRRPRTRWRDEVLRDLNTMGIKDRKWPVQRSITDCSIGRGRGGGEVVCEKGAVQIRVSWKWRSHSYWGLRPEMKFCPNFVRFSSEMKRWCPPKVCVCCDVNDNSSGEIRASL
jgi:hypothetical protein